MKVFWEFLRINQPAVFVFFFPEKGEGEKMRGESGKADEITAEEGKGVPFTFVCTRACADTPTHFLSK